MATPKETLKQYFKKYATPTESQFAELIEAFVHKNDDTVTQNKIEGLTEALDQKADINSIGKSVNDAIDAYMVENPLAAEEHTHAIADVTGLQAFIDKVDNFFENADNTDPSINTWTELKAFLSGINDSQTLASLLQAIRDYADEQDATNLQAAKDYADAQDATTLQAAKNYADEHDVSSLMAWTTRTITNTGTYASDDGTADFTATATIVENTYFADISFVLTTTKTSKYPISLELLDLGFYIPQSFFSNEYINMPYGLLVLKPHGMICTAYGVPNTNGQDKHYHFFVAKRPS